jgi:hypothetical protein
VRDARPGSGRLWVSSDEIADLMRRRACAFDKLVQIISSTPTERWRRHSVAVGRQTEQPAASPRDARLATW